MTSDEIKDRIRALISYQTGLDEMEISDDTSLLDAGCDELDMIEVLMGIEDECDLPLDATLDEALYDNHDLNMTVAQLAEAAKQARS